jgi:NAD(P)H-dependent flavin oxidoreductase YrpB (nitropropane dioxygenase family)
MFNSKYPIIALGMNQVSDLNLSLAVARAGAIPTLSIFNYLKPDNDIDTDKLVTDLELFKKEFKNYNFILSVDVALLIKYDKFLFEILKRFQITHIEIVPDPILIEKKFLLFKQILDKIKTLEIKLLVKMISIELDNIWIDFINQYFDGIIVKGPHGAGRVDSDSNKTLAQLTNECLTIFPDKCIVPCGGVGSSVEVAKLIQLGAGAVGMGTLFAVAQESPLSVAAKEQLVNSNFANLKKLKTVDFNQNALVLSEVQQSNINNTQGLVEGIRTGKTGHIFAGKSIDSITEIRPVSEIIKDLCTLL